MLRTFAGMAHASARAHASKSSQHEGSKMSRGYDSQQAGTARLHSAPRVNDEKTPKDLCCESVYIPINLNILYS